MGRALKRGPDRHDDAHLPRRLAGSRPSMTGYQRLCISTCGVIFILIIVGGIVRATDSGLGCPDWPTCHGRLIPDGNRHTIIEYSHRLTAALVGMLFLAIAIVAFRRYRDVPAILWPAIGSFVLVLLQAGIGA